LVGVLRRRFRIGAAEFERAGTSDGKWCVMLKTSLRSSERARRAAGACCAEAACVDRVCEVGKGLVYLC